MLCIIFKLISHFPEHSNLRNCYNLNQMNIYNKVAFTYILNLENYKIIRPKYIKHPKLLYTFIVREFCGNYDWVVIYYLLLGYLISIGVFIYCCDISLSLDYLIIVWIFIYYWGIYLLLGIYYFYPAFVQARMLFNAKGYLFVVVSYLFIIGLEFVSVQVWYLCLIMLCIYVWLRRY